MYQQLRRRWWLMRNGGLSLTSISEIILQAGLQVLDASSDLCAVHGRLLRYDSERLDNDRWRFTFVYETSVEGVELTVVIDAFLDEDLVFRSEESAVVHAPTLAFA